MPAYTGHLLVITIVDLEALVDVNVALKLVKLVRRRDVVYDRDEVQLQFRVSRTLKNAKYGSNTLQGGKILHTYY